MFSSCYYLDYIYIYAYYVQLCNLLFVVIACFIVFIL